jgi:photosystem II stability/assembly factor-like uncharacterized protein
MNQKQVTTSAIRSRAKILLSLLALSFLLIFSNSAEARKKKDEAKSDTLKSSTFTGLKWRGIGPAFTSGRIADFAVNPHNHSEYYVAVASGHVWKTVNNGTTFKPIFDNHKAYAMGVIEIAPTNTNIIWLGTGENNHQRALGYGNGVYKSVDAGASWKNMGLKESFQIGKILIHPENHDVVYVAAEGSTWGPGGDRGLYKTTDGGETWERILYVSENTGINEIVMDPRNPDILYATSEQRRRTTYTKIGGGPESAVYKSTDGGATWNKMMKGLPGVHIGGMGIAISPANPDYIYLIVEAQDDKSGFFRSTNGGVSWEKRSDYSASGQYYNEIFCDPKDPEKVYSMDVFSKVTTDGGKTWNNVGQNSRHVDDHAMWIDPDDTQHFIIGGDGGIYESFDGGKHYQFKTNLPITQFYRVNVDDTEPFYWVYGGTQDNNSLGGPSQNIKREGVTNDEWIVTLGGDGFFQAIEPGNPNIVYSAYQYGNIFRYDKQSTERIKIQPEPRKDELTYRWNWNTPFILSPHSKTRLYIGANKLFRSDDRGNSWQVISDDLTRNEDRNQFKVMDKYWPSNAVVKDVSTSLWGTILAIEESPVKEDLIYVGTDDGLVQITEDAGKNWRKISSFPGVPTYPYVSDILASKFDENTVFVSFDNLKNNDFKPYLLKSTDKGQTWTSIVGNLPQDETIHTIVQDHINPDLLFVGTEFNVFFTNDGGKIWTELSAGIPDIAMKDLVIQQRESDLVVATFGRGFYIIDDYSPLRHANNDTLSNSEAILFPVKDALLYVQTNPRYGQGSTYFSAPNPEFGAVFTYYLSEAPKTKKQERLKNEKELFKNGEKIPQPTVEELREEEKEIGPYLIFTITDAQGEEVNKIYTSPSTGINRVNWNLRFPSKSPVRLRNDKFDPKNDGNSGMFVIPGTYYVSLTMDHNGELKQLSDPVAFNVKYLNNRTLPAENPEELMVYQHNVAELGRTLSGTERYLDEMTKKIAHIRQAIHNATGLPAEYAKDAREIAETLSDISFEIYGSSPKASWEELPPAPVPLKYRYNVIAWSHGASTSAPTKTQMDQYQIVMEELPPIIDQIETIDAEIRNMERALEELKIPYTPGRFPKLGQ